MTDMLNAKLERTYFKLAIAYHPYVSMNDN